MDDGGPSAIALVILAILLAMDIVVYGFGTALHNMKAEDLDDDKESDDENISHAKESFKDVKKREFLKKTLENPTEYVNTVQLLVFAANLLVGRFYISYLSGYIHFDFGEISEYANDILSQIVSCILLLYVILSFGVLLPKKIAKKNPCGFAFFCAPVIKAIMIILYPFTTIINATVNGTLYLFGIRDAGNETDVTEEEIRSMVSEGYEQGVIQDSEANMITNIFEFSDKEVRDIMTHRNDIVGIDGTMGLRSAIDFMLEGNNSRFPVYLDNIDCIIGIVHIRDAMQKVSEDESNEEKEVRQIKGLMRKPMYVPETRKIESLFHSMQTTKTQMAIVIDEYGQTTGLVSMEDILEEIVGNIMDEYDEDETYITPSKVSGEFVALGKTPLETIEKRFGIDFHEDEFETLNGIMISKMDRIPEDDDKFSVVIDGYEFSILSVTNHMISEVLVRKITEKDSADKENEDTLKADKN